MKRAELSWSWYWREQKGLRELFSQYRKEKTSVLAMHIKCRLLVLGSIRRALAIRVSCYDTDKGYRYGIDNW
jgi:hypothetical protein